MSQFISRLRLSAPLLIGALLLPMLCSCDGRQRDLAKKKRAHVAVVNLAAGAPENPLSEGFLPIPASDSFLGLIRSLERAEENVKTRGVFVKAKGALFPFAQSKEAGEVLARLRKKNIPVVCHTHDLDNATFWLFSRGCSEIWLSAAGSVSTVGIGAELAYIKGTLDKLGIYPQMLAMGKYKSGGEALTRTEPSEQSLANLKSTISDLRNRWLAGVTAGHDHEKERRLQVEDGPWTPENARALGLVQRIGFEDQAFERALQLAKTDTTQQIFGPGPRDTAPSPAAEIVRMLAGGERQENNKSRIAVVPAIGAITMGADGPFASGDGITSGAMTRTLSRLRDDDSVKAIVVRMDSPGGSPLASDLIWREMMLTRAHKPVIVSISEMSASGGYYIASGASKIVSSETAIVGSIGVFGGKIVLEGALQKIGVTHFAIAASPREGAANRAAHLSPLTPWDAATEERVRQSMRSIYDLFVSRVAEGRSMSLEQVYATAEGEIFLAPLGKERGLIDELGGLERALSIAREMAGLPKDTPVVLEGTTESIFESLLLGPEPGAQEVQVALDRFLQRRWEATTQWSLGEHLKELRPFAAFVAPLLAGETVVTAVPFSLRLK